MNKSVKRTALAIVILLLGVWLYFYIRVNSIYKEPIVEHYKSGQVAFLNDYSIKMGKSKWISKDEAINEYKFYEEAFETEDYKFIAVEVEYTNTGNEKKTFETHYSELESGTWSNGINLEMFGILNPDESMRLTLEPGESKTLTFPFLILERVLKHGLWDNIEKEEFKYIVSLYPVKREFEI